MGIVDIITNIALAAMSVVKRFIDVKFNSLDSLGTDLVILFAILLGV